HFAPRHSLSEVSIFINLRDKLKDNIIDISIDYQKDLFTHSGIELMFERLETIFENYFKYPESKLIKQSILGKNEINHLTKFNQTDINLGNEDNFIARFNKSVESYPDNIAISDNGKNYRYSELSNLSLSMASKVWEQGKSSDTIAVIMKKSVDLIITILGILNTGKSYLPIDPNTPDDRIDYMLDNSNVSLIICDSSFESNLVRKYDTINIMAEDLSDNSILKESTCINHKTDAYTIYTSGSTGNPKGVSISHGNLINYINWAASYYNLGNKLIFPLYSSISFDLTITSIFLPLAEGGQIVVYEDEDFENAFLKIFEDNLVNTVKLTPSHLRIIQNMTFNTSSIKQLIVGGEELTYNISRTIYRN
ncbi:MAG: AMP-binding protein, partial [Candidatus Delongbacteria bacterium]|nr:AMP-binding protein [Candidatus Delongbacteria bacterium]